MRKLSTAVILATIILATATAYLWRERNEQRARGDALQLRVAELEAAATRGTAAPPAKTNQSNTGGDASTGTATPAAVSATAPATTAKGPQQADTAEDWLAFERRTLAIPEYREARRAQRKRELARLRDEGIRIVGVTPEQADKIIDSMVERELDWSGRPNPSNAEELQQRQRDSEENKRNEEAALRALLGDAKAAQWNEYLASQPSRSEVRQLRDALSESSEPLRDDQIEPLVNTLHTGRTQFMKEVEDYRASLTPDNPDRQAANRRYTQHYVEHMASANKRARKEAASILSGQQLAKFDATCASTRDLEGQAASSGNRNRGNGAVGGEDQLNPSICSAAKSTLSAKTNSEHGKSLISKG
jgi:hypothetical protein